jgi:aspartate kinase
VYSTDPNKITDAKKIKELSYTEMLDLSNEGAKVLHNRCVEIAEKYDVLIETGSTFNNNIGTKINNKIEESAVKSIVKNDNLFLITLKYENYNQDIFNSIYLLLLKNDIIPTNIINNSINSFNVTFTIKASDLGKFQELLESDLAKYSSSFTNISRISLVGYGIMNNKNIMQKTIEIFNINSVDIFSIQLEECKLSVMTKERVNNKLLEQLHHELIK